MTSGVDGRDQVSRSFLILRLSSIFCDKIVRCLKVDSNELNTNELTLNLEMKNETSFIEMQSLDGNILVLGVNHTKELPNLAKAIVSFEDF
jgi:hypothetical protein